MTTISPNRRRGGGGTLRLRLIGGGIMCILIVLVIFLWRAPVTGLLWRALGPLSGARTALVASAGDFFTGFSSQAALVAQNNTLRAQLASSSIVVLDRNMLYAENIDLKARLNRSVNSSSTLAAVLSRPPETPYDTLMLDVGSQNGIATGDLVAAGGSVYIGTIAQVYPTTSRALLFSAPGESYSALLMGSSTGAMTPVSVTGQGSGSLTAEVPAGVAVAVGDRVIFPGIVPQFIASVTAVESKAQESFQTIYMQLPVNPLTLQYVEVRRPQL